LKANATLQQMECGFVWACEYGRSGIVEFLLSRGMKADVMGHGITGLHWASYTGHVDIVTTLLDRNAPLETRDGQHGGTPLAWALYGWGEPPLEPKAESHNITTWLGF
jgi:ankyrin repeat protein